MEIKEYDVMASVEDKHFWFVSTRMIVKNTFIDKGLSGSRCLDIGCGTGGTMLALKDLGEFVGLDQSILAAQYARMRTGNPVLVGTGTCIALKSASFDCVLALDVFEHIENDEEAVREIKRVLKSGGILIATVPCHQCLFSEHDRALHHVRRYSRNRIISILESTGFVIERVTWINMTLFPMVAIHRLITRFVKVGVKPKSDASISLGFFNEIFKWIMLREASILKRINLPFGLSLLLVAKNI